VNNEDEFIHDDRRIREPKVPEEHTDDRVHFAPPEEENRYRIKGPKKPKDCISWMFFSGPDEL
jgi:hypothetical protein